MIGTYVHKGCLPSVSAAWLVKPDQMKTFAPAFLAASAIILPCLRSCEVRIGEAMNRLLVA